MRYLVDDDVQRLSSGPSNLPYKLVYFSYFIVYSPAHAIHEISDAPQVQKSNRLQQ